MYLSIIQDISKALLLKAPSIPPLCPFQFPTMNLFLLKSVFALITFSPFLLTFLSFCELYFFLFCVGRHGSISPTWSHQIHTALNMLFNADSKQFCERIIFILFNPPLHLYTFPRLQNCGSVPTIAPLPSSLTPCRPLCSLPWSCRQTGGQVFGLNAMSEG